MDRDLLEGRAVDQEVVDTGRVDALEEVVRRNGPQFSLDLAECFGDLVDEVRFYGVLEDGVTLFGDPPQMPFHLGFPAANGIAHDSPS